MYMQQQYVWTSSRFQFLLVNMETQPVASVACIIVLDSMELSPSSSAST